MEFLNNLCRYIDSHSNFTAQTIRKLLCFRSKYEKIDSGFRDDIPDISWLIEGNTLEALLWNTGESIDAKCDSFTYKIDNEHVVSSSYAKKEKIADYFCCGCQIPEDTSNDFQFDEPWEIRRRTLTEGETPFGALVNLFLEIDSREKIGRLTFKLHSHLDEENGPGFTRNMVWNHLERAIFDVPLLELKSTAFKKLDMTPFLELIQFRYLIMIAEEPLMLTEKILKSELLFLDVPILNIKELDKFAGFALLLGKMRINNFSLDLVCGQIEKYMEDVTSKIEFFAVFDLDPWVTEEMIDRLRSYSIQDDDDFPKPKCIQGETILRLDKEDKAAILIRGGRDVVFARNGWRKWQGFLERMWFPF